MYVQIQHFNVKSTFTSCLDLHDRQRLCYNTWFMKHASLSKCVSTYIILEEKVFTYRVEDAFSMRRPAIASRGV